MFQIDMVCRSETCGFLKHVSDWHCANFAISKSHVKCKVKKHKNLWKETQSKAKLRFHMFQFGTVQTYRGQTTIFNSLPNWNMFQKCTFFRTAHHFNLKNVSEWHMFQNGTQHVHLKWNRKTSRSVTCRRWLSQYMGSFKLQFSLGFVTSCYVIMKIVYPLPDHRQAKDYITRRNETERKLSFERRHCSQYVFPHEQKTPPVKIITKQQSFMQMYWPCTAGADSVCMYGNIIELIWIAVLE